MSRNTPLCYHHDVMWCILDFLSSFECDRLASVHPLWHSMARERQMTFCINDAVLTRESVQRASYLLSEYAPVVRRLPRENQAECSICKYLHPRFLV